VKADFMARTGSDVVYFAGTGHLLDASARTTLTAQAQWLLANPTIQVRIEGHSDLADTRDHALAVGKRRADSVRDFLLLNGVPAAQVTAVSFGKERPATNGPGEAMAALNRRAVTVLVR
jgi:peptidoglycan-associated lipoprotein